MSHLNRNNMIIRWFCSMKLTEKIPSNELRSRLGLCSIENGLGCGCCHWYGHLEHMNPNTVDKKIVTGNNPRGYSRKAWFECIRDDFKVKCLEASLTQNRPTWHWTLNHWSQHRHGNEVVQPSNTGNNTL